MSLIEHAEAELARAGYSEELKKGIRALIKAHAEQDHDNAPHALTVMVFNRLVNFQALTPLTNDPEEWMEVGPGVWQSKRQADAFSRDGGTTYYCLDEPNRPTHVAEVKRT